MVFSLKALLFLNCAIFVLHPALGRRGHYRHPNRAHSGGNQNHHQMFPEQQRQRQLAQQQQQIQPSDSGGNHQMSQDRQQQRQQLAQQFEERQRRRQQLAQQQQQIEPSSQTAAGPGSPEHHHGNQASQTAAGHGSPKHHHGNRDPCAGNNCFNGGTCKPDINGPNGGGFECICSMKRRGKYCEKKMHECRMLACKKIRDCGSLSTGSTCICTTKDGSSQACVMDKKSGKRSFWKSSKSKNKIIMAVTGSFILLFSLCLCMHCCRARSRKKQLEVNYREAVESGYQPLTSPPSLMAVSTDLFKSTFCCAKSSFPESYIPGVPTRSTSDHAQKMVVVELPEAVRQSTRSLLNEAQSRGNVRLSAHTLPSSRFNGPLQRSTSILRNPSKTYGQRNDLPEAIDDVIRKHSSRSIGSRSHIPAFTDAPDEVVASRLSQVQMQRLELAEEASNTCLPNPPDDEDDEDDGEGSESGESEPELKPQVIASGSMRGSLIHAPQRRSDEKMYNMSTNARFCSRIPDITRSGRNQKAIWDLQEQLGHLRLKYEKGIQQRRKLEHGQNMPLRFQ
ncbi:uncharacterized protein LOC127857757 isoform X2 [Dreissena polymorpha]|uniref:uncharacterized protein LOC127857757 isoform X2 n=1 Tax=Dreissena polymorpha TaxID=45954 RepID=UPI0022644E34|nr:uncharacterized protein LOC127857757 isoform X2 [Dreissena polymorpha]